MTDWDKIVSDLENSGKLTGNNDQEKRDLTNSLSLGYDSNPDEAAENSRISQRTGLPVDVVERNKNEVNKTEYINGVPVDEILTGAPVAARFLSDINISKQAHDDVESLRKIESGWRVGLREGFKAATGFGYAAEATDVARAVPGGGVTGVGMGVSGVGGAIQSVQRQIARGLDFALPESMDKFIWADPNAPEWVNKFGQATDVGGMMRSTGGAVKDIGEWIGPDPENQNLATDIASGVGQMAGQISALIVAPWSGSAMLFGQGVDQQLEKQQAVGVEGASAETDMALLLGGATTMALERVGLDRVMNWVPLPVKNKILRNLADVAGAGGVEAVEEVLEGVTQNLIEYAVYNPNAQIFEGIEREALAAGGSGAIVRAILNGIAPGRTRLQSESDHAKLNEVITAVEQSKLKDRNPDLAREYMELLGADTGSDTLFVDAQGVDLLFQQITDPAVIQSDVVESLVEQLPDALETGSKIQIPLADLPSLVSNGLARSLQPYMTTDIDAMSIQQQQDIDVQAEVMAIRQMEEAERSTELEVYNDVLGMELARGVDRSRAESHAALYEAFFRTLSKREGITATPMELYERYGLNIRNEIDPRLQAQAKRVEQMDLMLDRLRTGDIPKDQDIFGDSLLQFIRKEGGIKEDGGELSAMDARGLIRPNTGRTLDDIAERAVEEGFMQERDPNALIDLIRDEMGGQATYRLGAENQQLQDARSNLEQLQSLVDRAGLDLANMSNEEIRTALLEGRTQSESALAQGDGNVIDLSKYRKKENSSIADILAEIEQDLEVNPFVKRWADRLNDEYELAIAKLKNIENESDLTFPIPGGWNEDFSRIEGEFTKAAIEIAEQVANRVGIDPDWISELLVDDVAEDGSISVQSVIDRLVQNLETENDVLAQRIKNEVISGFANRANPSNNTLYQSFSTDEIEFLKSMGVMSDEEVKANEAESARELQTRKVGRTITGAIPRKQWAEATEIQGVGSNGKRRPIKVWHGGKPLEASDYSEGLGKASEHPSATLGVWFTTDPDDASTYGQPSDFFLDIRNPKVYTLDEDIPSFASQEDAAKHREQLKSEGYDGIVFDYSSAGAPVHFVAFDPEQTINGSNRTPDRLYQREAFQPPVTGRPIKLHYAKNQESASKFAVPPGMDFGQDIEIAGDYLVVQERPMGQVPVDNWDYGTVQFNNPIVLEHKSTGSTGWKKDLSDAYGGLTGKALADAVKADGYDGVITYDDYGYSESVNLNADKKSGEVDSDVLYQRTVEQPENLYVAHNLSEENLKHVVELGGLAAPSLAVGNIDAGPFQSFGDITLIADPNIINDKTIPFFDSDIYSPRQPRANYDIDSKAYRKLMADMLPSMKEVPDFYEPQINELEDTSGVDRLINNDAFQYYYLKTIGKEPKPKKLKVDPIKRKAINYAKKLGTTDFFTLADDPEFQKFVQDYYLGMGAARGDEMRFFQDDGTLSRRQYTDYAQGVVNYIRSDGIDKNSVRDGLRKKMRVKKTDREFREFAEQTFNDLVKGKTVFVGTSDRTGAKKYKPYTLDNIVAQMTKDLRGGESFNYGNAGFLRSAVANKILSVGAAKKQRDRIVSSADLKAEKEYMNEQMEKLVDDLNPYYKFDQDSWHYQSDAVETIMNYAMRKGRLDEAFDIDQEMRDRIDGFLVELQNMPTEYFEGKAQRAMALSEFKTAIVPRNASKETKQILRDAGLKIKLYEPGDVISREEAIRGQSKLLFQSAYHGTPHKFDRFSLDAMGTGEGAQAFGWGMYFAGNRGVAEWYRDTLSNSPNALRASRGLTKNLENAVLNVTDNDLIAETFSGRVYEMGFDPESQSLYDFIEETLPPPTDVESRNFNYQMLEAASDEAVIEASVALVTPNEGQLYEVDIPDDSDLLDYDKPLSEQPEKVKSALVELKETTTGITDIVDFIDSSTLDDLERIESLLMTLDRNGNWEFVYGEIVSTIAEGGEETPEVERQAYERFKEIATYQYRNDPDEREAANDFLKIDFDSSGTGQQLYAQLQAIYGSDMEASKALNRVGIPGHRFLDGMSRNNGEGNHNYVIWDESVVSIQSVNDEQRAADLQSQGNKDTGRVRGYFDRADNTITLTKDQNLSTFLHESGHFFLEVMRDLAPQSSEIQHDLNKLEGWWESQGAKDDRDRHEMFASGFETYLMEGKAPTPELQSLFSRFRIWLTSVYKSLTAPFRANNLAGTQISDEVRSVMDRLVATQDAIDEATKNNGFGPSIGQYLELTQEQAQEYQAMVNEAEDEAMAELTAKAMKEAQREQERWWKDELAREAEQVESELEFQQVYTLRDALTGDRPLEGFPNLKLNSAYIRTEYGQATSRKLQRMTSKDGVDPNSISLMFGYNSGEELVMDLVNSMTKSERQAYVKAEAEKRMKDKHGDMLNDGTLVPMAEKAVHNDKQSERLVKDLQLLNARAGQKKATPREFFREAARQSIAETALRDIKPHVYRRQEQTARMKAIRLAAKGEYRQAAIEQHRAVRQHYLLKEAESALKDAEKTYKFAKSLMAGGRKKTIERAGDSYIAQVDNILSWLQFKKVSDKWIAKKQSMTSFINEQLAQAGAGDPNVDNEALTPEEIAAKKVSMVEDAQRLSPSFGVTEAMIAMSESTNYRELKPSELAEVDEMLRSIFNLAKLKNKLLTNQDKRTLEEWVDTLESSIIDNPSSKGSGRKTGNITKGERVTKAALEFLEETRTPTSLIKMLDGYDEGGPAWEIIGKPLQDAATDEAVQQDKANQDLEAIFNKHYTSKELKDLNKLLPGRNDWSKHDVVTMLLNWGNEVNRARVMDGWGIDETYVEDLFERYLDKRDYEFVKDVWAYLETWKKPAFDLHRDMFGFTPDEVEAQPFETKFGTMPGGYYPIAYDPAQSVQAGQHDVQKTEGSFTKALNAKNKLGSTQARTDVVKRPLQADMTKVIFNHVAEVIHSTTHDRALYDVGRVLANKRIHDAITQHHGEHVYKALSDVVRELRDGGEVARTRNDRMIQWMRNNATFAMLGASIRTVILQPFGISNSIVEARLTGMSVRRLFNSYGKFVSNAPRYSEEIKAKSKYMTERERVMNVAIARIQNQVKKTGSFEKAKQWTMVPMQKMQWYTVDAPLWLAAYEFAKSKGFEEEKAVALADQNVRDAQGGGGVMDTAKVMRSGPAMKLMTNFLSYMAATYNIERKAIDKWRKGENSLLDLVGNTIALVTLPSVLMAILNDFVAGEDDDEEFGMRLLKEHGSFVMGMNPITAQASGVFTGFDYSGPQGLSLIGKIVELSKQTYQGEMDRSFFKALFWAIGLTTGLPAAQFNRTAFGMLEGIEDDESAAKITKQALFGPER